MRTRHNVVSVVLLFGLFATTASTVLAAVVERGPYLQQVTPDSITVRWRTDDATDAIVRYGTADGALNLTAVGNQSGTEHEVTISALVPGTLYFYSVGDSTGALAGGDSTFNFTTSPASGSSGATRIWAIGDSGTADNSARAVRDAYLTFAGNQPANFWLMLGDNAYEDGTDTEYQRAVFDMYPTVLRNTPLWTTLGNHDGHTADSDSEQGPYYDIFTMPRNGEAGGLASGTEAYYSFDYGNIHLITLDSYDTDRSTNGAMMTWLENDLAATSKEWLIAYWHHPPYSKGSHNSDSSSEGQMRDMRERALPILESYGVDLVLSGHSHSYERSTLIDGHYGLSNTFDPTSMQIDGGSGRADETGAYSKPVIGGSNQGTVYAVAGSSGKISSGALNHPVMFVSLQTLGSVVLDINGGRLDAAFIDSNGTRRDYFTLEKGAPAADNSPPTSVINLTASPITSTSVTLTWNAATDNVEVTGYRVSRGGAVVSNNNALSFVDSNLTAGTSYSYTIVTLDAVGNESQPSTITATTQTAGGSTSVGSSGGGAAGMFELFTVALFLGLLRHPATRRSIPAMLLIVLLCLPQPVMAHGDIDERIAAVTVRLQGAPDDYGLLAKRGNLHGQHGDQQLAVADLTRAQVLAPHDVAAALDLDIGLALHRADNAGKALHFVDRYLLTYPRSSAAWRLRAQIQLKLNNIDTALEDINRSLNYASIRTPEHYFERARILEPQPDRFDERIAGIDEGIERLGPLASLLQYAIDAEVQHGKFASALVRIDALPEPIRKQPRWLYRRSQVLQRLGRHAEAKRVNRAALQAIEDLPARRNRASAYTSLRRDIETSYAAMANHKTAGGTG